MFSPSGEEGIKGFARSHSGELGLLNWFVGALPGDGHSLIAEAVHARR